MSHDLVWLWAVDKASGLHKGVPLTYVLTRALEDMLEALHSAAAWQSSFMHGSVIKGRTDDGQQSATTLPFSYSQC